MEINLLDYGVKWGIDSAALIIKAFADASTGDTIIFPDTKISVNSTLQLTKAVWLKGSYNSQLCTGLNVTALEITGNWFKPARITDIDFINWYGKDDRSADGLRIHAVVDMQRCWVKSFGGTGIVVSGDIAHGKTNASFSKFEDVLISENGNHGIYFQGGDANQCTVFHCDARDNKGVGFYDHSFLGNQFLSLHGTLKRKKRPGSRQHKRGTLSNYRADDANNRAGFYGCYSESGSAPEWLNGACTWHGGFPSNGVAYCMVMLNFIMMNQPITQQRKFPSPLPTIILPK
jgi:hypothetical protein